MKEKKKPKGTKAEIRSYKKRLTLIGTAIIIVILVVIIAFSSFLIYSYLNPSSSNQPPALELKAAIIDHLSLTVPNQTFIQTATNILETANYTVGYYAGEEVNVEFYRNLPTHGYSLIVLRVHSTASEATGTGGPVTLFTSEPYSTTKHVYEQLTDQLCGVAYSREQGEKGIKYFGIGPLFVSQSMKGRFQNTTIIMMGCEGLDNPSMAQAFIEKGAKVYISWSLPVSGSHTDKATKQLLKHLITEKQTIKQAVTETMKEVGPDPAWGSILVVYPETVVYDHIVQD
jgi:hypothetical protein